MPDKNHLSVEKIACTKVHRESHTPAGTFHVMMPSKGSSEQHLFFYLAAVFSWNEPWPCMQGKIVFHDPHHALSKWDVQVERPYQRKFSGMG